MHSMKIDEMDQFGGNEVVVVKEEEEEENVRRLASYWSV